MKDVLSDIKRFLERYASKTAKEDDSVADLTQVRNIMRAAGATYDKAEYATAAAKIEKYIARGEVERRKLAAFCKEISARKEQEDVCFHMPEDDSAHFDDDDRAVKQRGKKIKTRKKLPKLRVIVSDSRQSSPTTRVHARTSLRDRKYSVVRPQPTQEDFEQLVKFVRNHDNENAFQEKFFELLDRKGIEKNSDVYNATGMSRQTFHNAFSGRQVDKRTVWRLAIGLKCTLAEADELLESAGFVRTNSKFDVIMKYFIEKRIYEKFDKDDIDEWLVDLGQKPFVEKNLDRKSKEEQYDKELKNY